MLARSRRRPLGPGFCTATLLVMCAVVYAWVLPAQLVAAEGDAGGTAPGRIAFVAKNSIVTANGVFHQWKILESRGGLDAMTQGHVLIEIDVASLDTGIKRRDNHLRSKDFFEVERWPTAQVRVHSANPIGAEHYRAKFDIQIRAISKTIDGEFEVVSRAPLKIRGSLTIDRTDFGVGEPKSWNPMSITNEIPITFEAVLAD